MTQNDAPATKQDVKDIINAINRHINFTSEKFDEIDQKFEKIDQRLDAMQTYTSTRFDTLERRMNKTEEAYQHLLGTIDAFLGRIDGYETEMTARDSQFNKLLKWAKDVSKKTGVPMPEL